jgi:osmotically inducible protein OsmC
MEEGGCVVSKEVHQSATVVWTGTIARGGGEVSGASGALGPLAVDLPNRLGEATGKTTPEELLAAAHATCFATALGSVLAGRKTPPQRLEVQVTVTLDLTGARSEIPLIEIEATGDVPGSNDASFAEALKEAEGRCLISRVLTGGTTLKASGRLV